MSNRVKVKPTRLGARKVDAFAPIVYDGTDQAATETANRTAARTLAESVGPWKAGDVEWRLYLGHGKVIEVLRMLADAGAIPADGKHTENLALAASLGERAAVVIASCPMLSAGLRAREAATRPPARP